MIQVENLTKGYGHHMLLENVSFRLNSRERVGLVGRNGHGKTTLLRLLTGESLPDEGAVTVPRNYRIGYVRQHLAFHADTALAEGMTGLLPAERDHFWKVEKVLAGLGFAPDDLQRPPESFSGGYQIRLNLAKVLVSEPDLLLLDEPTNYLDITAIRWLVRFLDAWPRELMVITHDRGFMDQVITHVLGIHRRGVRKVAGDTGTYYDQISQEEQIHENTRLRQERRRKDMEQFITRFRAKARLAGLVQSRVKTLAKMRTHARLEQIHTLAFRFRHRPLAGKHVLRAESLTFGYEPDRPLLSDLDLSISAGERVAVVGPNGLGKTTLLKLLAGQLTPGTGRIDLNANVAAGLYEQTHVQSLVDTRTVEEEILAAEGGGNRQRVRDVCGAMMFSGDDALKRISVLSGGEKARVMLGKLLAAPLNLLLLDEPTHHLDLDSSEALLAALEAFEGAVVMVTHNEMFLHALFDRMVVFQAGKASVFTGGYADFLQRQGWIEERPPAKPPKKRSRPAAPAKAAPTKPKPRPAATPAGTPAPGGPKRRRRRRAAARTRPARQDKARDARCELRQAVEARRMELGYLQDALAAEQDSGRAAELEALIAACRQAMDRDRKRLEGP